jgi:hypothetical protein
MRRRELLAGAALAGASAAAGCLGIVGLDEHEATPAGVDPDVREQTGYEQTAVEEVVVEETFERGPISETITVRNYLTEHDKTIDLGPLGSVRAATFVVFTSPQISIAGRELNPIEGMSPEEVTDMLEDRYGRIKNVEHVEDGEATVLDQDTTESIFEAEVELEGGQTVDVFLHVTESVQTTNDHLVTIGVYPRRVREIEADNMTALMGGVVESIE